MAKNKKKTIKKPTVFSKFGKKKFQETSHTSKSGTKKFAALPILATTTLAPLKISDEEKKEDHEKLEGLLSQESFDQNTNEEIYKLLNKYGYTEETIYALLEGYVGDNKLLDEEDIFNLKEFFPLHASKTEDKKYLDKDVFTKEFKSDNFTFSRFKDRKQLKYVNVVKLKKSLAKTIWTVMPWVLKSNIEMEESVFKIDLNNFLQASSIISKFITATPYTWYSEKKILQELRKIESGFSLLSDYYNNLKEPHQTRAKYFKKEFSNLAEIYNEAKRKQNNLEQTEKINLIINNEFKMLKNLKEHCKEEGCEWIGARLKVFEENFPEWQSPISQEPSKKSGTLFTPSSEQHSFWGQILNYFWPSYYYPRK